MPTKKTKPSTPSVPAKTKASASTKNVLGFKLLRNVLIPGLEPWMKTGLPPLPKMKLVQAGTLDSRELDPKTMTMQPKRFDIVVNSFDLENQEFLIDLPQTTPRNIPRESMHSARFHDALVDAEAQRTIKSREEAEKLRRILVPLVEGEPERRNEKGQVVGGTKPTIVITSDKSGFMNDQFLDDDQFDELRESENARTAATLTRQAERAAEAQRKHAEREAAAKQAQSGTKK